MRTARMVVVGALVLKVVVLGTWWWDRAWAAKETGDGAADASAVPADVLAKSRGFRELLEGVRQRGTDLDQREQALKARESALKTLEKTLADEVTHLEGLAKAGGVPAAPGTPVTAPADGAPASAGVTKVYESMKPDEAGPIFDKLDDQVALGILRRMKERQIGAILAAMSRDRAVVMTKLLAQAGIVAR